MERELYMKLKIKDIELSPFELEKIFYEALKERVGREFDFPEEDIIITPIEFYENKIQIEIQFVLELIAEDDRENTIPYNVFDSEEEAEKIGKDLIKNKDNNYVDYQVIPMFESTGGGK